MLGDRPSEIIIFPPGLHFLLLFLLLIDLVLDQWSRCGQLEYQYFTTPANWSDAERQCQTHGGNLANVEGFVSGNCALQSFQSCDTGSAWVGLGSILSANDYRWTSDLTITSQFQFNFLAFRELEFCAVLGRPLSYRLEKCRLFNTYICQRRRESLVLPVLRSDSIPQTMFMSIFVCM